MAEKPTTPSVNPLNPKPQTEAGIAFAKWLKERRKLTDEEIADIELLISDLKRGYDTLKLKPRTEYGIAFAQWALDYAPLTQADLLDIEAQIQALKPVPPPPPPPPVTPKPLTQYEWQMKKKAEEEAKAKEEAAAKAKLKPVPPAPEKPPKQPTVKPELIIKRTHYPKWWNDEGVAAISLTSPGSQFVISARGDYSLFIGAIVLTVSGECQLTFSFGTFGAMGKIRLGGADEPRGIVIAMGNSPAPCGTASFMITAESSEAVNVGGFTSYFLWKKEA